MRNLRVRADENVPPAVTAQKTIHHRNKSSPALSSMLGAAGLKAPAKRTAFGDVSNTFNGLRLAKDDGAISLKQIVQVTEKSVAEKKPTTFLKQASRPYSVSNLRGLLPGAGGIAGLELPSKPAHLDTNGLANPRKIVTKRPATSIFKDATLPALQKAASKSVNGPQPPTTTIPVTEPPSLPEVSLATETTNAARSQSSLALGAILDDAEEFSVQPNNHTTQVEDSVALRSDGIYLDEQGNVHVYQAEQPEPDYQRQNTSLGYKPTSTSQTKPEAYEPSVADVLQSSYASIASGMPYGQQPKRAEPEEYWEEEEDENYEEEGYVTARSFRSRGDNTTGGATTVLFPQVNQKIKRELETAKELVELERTPEEIEDECYDTSMVAEYGDEIFDYMRDLEVRTLVVHNGTPS